MDSPRRYLAELSPITQRTASMILDLPQPFGPTTAVRFVGNGTVVGSTNDLKPASLMDFSRISRALLHENAQHLLSLVLAEFADRLLQASDVILDCGISQVPEEGRRLCYFATEMLKCNVVSAADGRAKILKGLLQERIFNQTIGILNNTKACLNHTLCSVIGVRIKRIDNFPEFINLPHQSAQLIARPAFKDFATEHAEQVYVNIVKRVHGINGQLRDNSASARVDPNQMPTFQNQQGLTDRTTADVEFTRHFQFLNTLPRLQVTDHDPLADMLGNLL